MSQVEPQMDMSLSDFDSSVVVLSDSEISSVEPSPVKITPAPKRKRDDLLEDARQDDQIEDLGFIDSIPTSENFIAMERGSPEPRRKNPGNVTPSKSYASMLKKAAEPGVVEEKNFDDNLPETVTLLKSPGGQKVYVVGTAHFSKESQEDVAKIIRAVQPHFIVVELCQARIDIMLMDEEVVLAAAKEINLQKVMQLMKKNGAIQGLLYLTLLTMSAHVTNELGMAPGGEFRTALKEGQHVPSCTISLGDRPINVTMSRLLHSLSWWQRFKLVWNIVSSKEPIKKEDVENAKKRDFLEAMLAEMAGEFPSLKEVLVSERDVYLTYSLQNAAASDLRRPDNQPSRVVGVVGIGHVAGIKEHWGKVTEEEIARIMHVPPTSLTSKIIKHSVRLALVGGTSYLLYKVGRLTFRALVRS